jgi:hypothetical protein
MKRLFSLLAVMVAMAIFNCILVFNFYQPIQSDMPIEFFTITVSNILPYFENGQCAFISFMAYLLARVLILFILGDFIYEDFRICSVYVFTRKDSRASWFIGKIVRSVAYILMYYMGFIIIGASIACACGLSLISIGRLVAFSAAAVGLDTLTSLIFVLLTNILSFYLSAEISLFSTIALYIIGWMPSLVNIGDGVRKLSITISPVYQPLLTWHDDSFLSGYISFLNLSTMPGFKTMWSFVVLLLYLILMIYIGLMVVKNVEIIGKS